MIAQLLQDIKQKLGTHFPDLLETLNPPASEEKIQQAEKTIGYALPEEVKALYRIHDGESGHAGFFFGLPFLSLNEALAEWNTWKKVSEQDTSSIDNSIISNPSGCIKEVYTNNFYFPISKDFGGNNLSVDMDPGEKGKAGQIINSGRDEEIRYVIASDLSDFLKFILEQIQAGNFSIEEHDEEVKSWYLKEPENSHFLDTLKDLELPYGADHSPIDTKKENFEEWYESLDDTWKEIVTDHCGNKKNFLKISQLKKMTLMDMELKDLKPLAHFTGLRELVLTKNPFTDISPLAHLHELKKLYLALTNTQDVQALTQLSGLTQISFRKSELKTIEGLSQLKKLKELGLASTKLTDLKEVSKIKSLTELDISENQFDSFEELASLKKLKRLDVSQTNLKDLSFLSELKKLEELTIYETEVTDYSILKSLPNLNHITCSYQDFLKLSALIPRKIRFGIYGEMTEEQEEKWKNYLKTSDD